jgi:aryl-alcohol dehydrogenase-like predicted oxidoreductase
MDPTTAALGTWSGGRFMHFGEPVEEERLEKLLRPGDGIDTVITADVYGAGEADTLVGRSLSGVPRDSYCLVGAIGHDFYEGTRDGAKGFPRFTDPTLRSEDEFSSYIRHATERSLARIGVDHFDLLLLHNPDQTGYSNPAVWEGLQATRDDGLARMLGVAPGPANGFTLDLIDCFERFAELIEWAMIILSPMEPWPGELVLAAAARNDVKLITRVVDYGGLFYGDIQPKHVFGRHDHRAFRPAGWVEEGLAKLDRMRPYADRYGISLLQLACYWNLAHEPVACVAPTLLQEPGPGARTIEDKRAELAAVNPPGPFSDAEIAELRAIGDNAGCMALKGASTEHEGPVRADRWGVGTDLRELAARWSIDPERDLTRRAEPAEQSAPAGALAER